MQTKKSRSIKAHSWFYQAIGNQEKLSMKHALAVYLVETNQTDDLPEACTDTYLRLLPYVAKLEARWGKVNKDNFHPTSFTAHQGYADTIRNTLKSKRELKSHIKDVEDKLRQETVTEHGGDTDDGDWEIEIVDDDSVMQEAQKTPKFEKPGG